jgi:predicted short-subunit dehydrogenase-like oxidoreductase (DUF2520 family)
MFKDIPTIPILLVGAGNVAWHLGLAMKTSGLPVTLVWSRKLNNANELAKELESKATDSIEDIFRFNGIILFCIPDHVIPYFASRIHNTNSIIVHTAGSISISAFEQHASQLGVFYPLQTFTKAKPEKNFNEVPVLIESTTLLVEEILTFWAKVLGAKLYKLTSPQRLKIHVAAVFACNFTNHMVSIAEEIAQDNHLNFDLLKPLIVETLTNIMKFDPKDIQTGPALRKDYDTIEKHLNSLSTHPDYAKIYNYISNSIIKMHFEK